jgi:hypothetical protein
MVTPILVTSAAGRVPSLLARFKKTPVGGAQNVRAYRINRSLLEIPSKSRRGLLRSSLLQIRQQVGHTAGIDHSLKTVRH